MAVRSDRHATQNNTPDNTKSISIDALNARLADLIDLALITKQAHWNLKGTQFIGVHEMLDGFRDSIDDYADTVAERAVALGGTAYGTVQDVAKGTSITPYPTNIYRIADHIAALIDRYAVVTNNVRQSIKVTNEAGDDTTSNIFQDINQALDKHLWFLEAHVQEPSGDFRDGDHKGAKTGHKS